MTEAMDLTDRVELRPATPSDPIVVALTNDQQAELGALYGVEDQPLDALQADIGFIVLLVDGTPVGCVGLQPVSPGLGEIKRMYVVPPARGRGLSRLLLAQVESLARSQGLTTLRLETGTRQHEAMALYTRHGYTPIALYPPYENDPFSRCFAKTLH